MESMLSLSGFKGKLRGLSVQERFEYQYMPEPMSGCWIWLGALTKKGYANRFQVERFFQQTPYRWAFEFYREVKIPAELVLDHLCRNRACVNPWHLEAVSNKENIYRGIGIAAYRAKQTHCIYGHEFTTENTYIRKGKLRQCKTCHRKLRNRARDRRRLNNLALQS